MKIRNEHTTLLTELLPQYRLLNSLCLNIVENSALSFEEQCSITDFHNQFNDKTVFEKAIVNLILSTDKEKQLQIISNLKTEISKNIDTYTTHKDLFNEIDTRKVCTDRYNPIRIETEGQSEIVNKLRQEFTLIRGNLESASWNNNKIKIQRLTEEEERVEKLYRIEQEKLQSLYKQQKESDNHAFLYTKNVFERIHELSLFHISLLNSYFSDEGKNEIVPESVSEPEGQNIAGNTTKIEPDMIFRMKMYERFLILEQRLKAKKIEVIPAKDGKKPMFFGGGAVVHQKIREKMFEVLYSKAEYDFLDEPSLDEIEMMRKDFAVFNIIA